MFCSYQVVNPRFASGTVCSAVHGIGKERLRHIRHKAPGCSHAWISCPYGLITVRIRRQRLCSSFLVDVEPRRQIPSDVVTILPVDKLSSLNEVFNGRADDQYGRRIYYPRCRIGATERPKRGPDTLTAWCHNSFPGHLMSATNIQLIEGPLIIFWRLQKDIANYFCRMPPS